MISQYNAAEPVRGPYKFMRILIQRARVEGFVVIDYMDRFQEAYEKWGRWLAEDKELYDDPRLWKKRAKLTVLDLHAAKYPSAIEFEYQLKSKEWWLCIDDL